MELVIDGIEDLIYIYEEVFWLKECLTALQSLVVFLLVWWIVRFDYRLAFLLYLSTFIGVACIFFGDIGYWSDNDVLKLIAPASLFLLLYNKNQNKDVLLLIILIPYFVTSYEFYRSFSTVIESLASLLPNEICIFRCLLVS